MKEICNIIPKGRFAPSPTGRMHMGNVFTALLSWLSVRSRGGKWVLRIEDLDPQRSKVEHSRRIEDDLHWLELEWDEGGLDNSGDAGPYCQSGRHGIYERFLSRLKETGLVYGCTCTRADIMATQAPHQSDGRVIYGGRCRPGCLPASYIEPHKPHSERLYVPDRMMTFDDVVYGRQSVNLASHCGDFVLRRADGAWAYQLAVVVDDAMMGITEVVRGNDLLLSTGQQLYLYDLLGFSAPRFAHVPLVCNKAGQRLSKRDAGMGMDEMRLKYSSEDIIGRLACMAGLIDEPQPVTPSALLDIFDWEKVRKEDVCVI